MRYPIDFLMKHNIAFSCPWFFIFGYHTLSHKYTHTHRGKKINIILYALHSQTPSNLSALNFKVWVFAYFVLDCCHHKSRELKGLLTVHFFSLSLSLSLTYTQACMQHLVWRVGDKSAVHTGQVCQRSHLAIYLITVFGSCFFERSSVANLPLMPITSPRHKNISNYLHSPPVKISISMRNLLITRELSHIRPLSNSQWPITDYYTSQLFSYTWKSMNYFFHIVVSMYDSTTKFFFLLSFQCLFFKNTHTLYVSCAYKQGFPSFALFFCSFQSELFVASKHLARRCC